MKHRVLAIIGLASPILLVGFCIMSLLILGTLSWLFFGSDDGSAITKIATVGPFFTAKILPSVSEPEEVVAEDGASPNESDLAAQPETVFNDQSQVGNQPAEAQQVAAGPVLSDEEVADQLGFALPADTVNSITHNGVGNRLIIPSMSLDAPILLAPIENQTWKVDHLGQSIGHLEGTAKPGSDSNLVLAAHVSLEGGEYGPFAGLGKLNPGDTVVVFEGEQKFEYMIDSHQTVDRTAVDVTFPSETGQITLITCNSWNASEARYDERLVVKGHLITN